MNTKSLSHVGQSHVLVGPQSRLERARQKGWVVNGSETPKPFNIRASVRQGCVLRPRSFRDVLEWAMCGPVWFEISLGHLHGVHLQQHACRLADLRFASCAFSPTAAQVIVRLISRIYEWRQVLRTMLGRLLGLIWLDMA